jgi:ParB/RepB/Spo0J family partition protein
MRIRTGIEGRTFELQRVPVARIRPEEGLGRQRDRQGHRELCRSIEQFGVLTPITVRRAPDGSGDYVLIKGQGRTLACRLLGLPTIPAVVVDDQFADAERVQQFLAENVARLRMRPLDRALLITHARRKGEETADVAKRFGVSASTVRRLEAQLEGAGSGEVRALRDHNVNLSLHAVIARHVASTVEREAVIEAVGPSGIKAKDLEVLLPAIGWEGLCELGPQYRQQRVELLAWASGVYAAPPKTSASDRLRRLALQWPDDLGNERQAVAGETP